MTAKSVRSVLLATIIDKDSGGGRVARLIDFGRPL